MAPRVIHSNNSSGDIQSNTTGFNLTFILAYANLMRGLPHTQIILGVDNFLASLIKLMLNQSALVTHRQNAIFIIFIREWFMLKIWKILCNFNHCQLPYCLERGPACCRSFDQISDLISTRLLAPLHFLHMISELPCILLWTWRWMSLVQEVIHMVSSILSYIFIRLHISWFILLMLFWAWNGSI